MPSDAAIRVERVSKRYRLGMREPYRALRDTVSTALSRAVRGSFCGRPGGNVGPDVPDYVWALKDVSFEVARGQAVGIIGPNGAGKSTLLKVLSRITSPTEGRVEVHGRLGSLLEVGTGFHPELTGRENIFLNGAILGMRRAEILRKFDDIVAFAEVERFIDTPVKRYSSGMYLRLAFAVAAHLELDILAVDEVLAVGDVAFQKKCLGKMEEIRDQQGRTVFFVSHNLGAVKLLTTTCLLVNQGRLVAWGKTEEIVQQYLQTGFPVTTNGSVDLSGLDWRRGTTKSLELNLTYQLLRLLNSRGQVTNVFFEREPVTVELTFQSRIKARSVELIMVILTLEGMVVFSSFSGPQYETAEEGRYRVTCAMDPNILRSGDYRLRLYLRSGNWQDIIAEATTFRIESSPVGYHEMGYAATNPGLMGAVRTDYTWGELQRQ